MALVDETIGAEDAIAVTPSDTADLELGLCKGIWVGVAGNVQITTARGRTAVYVAMTAGVTHPIRAKRIWSTGTTATSILALY